MLRKVWSLAGLARLAGVCFTLVCLCAPARGQQTTVTLQAAADNTLYQSTTGSVSNGAGGFMFTGLTNAGSIRRGLIRFDLTTIPAGATINSVTLTLTMSRANNNTARATTLHRVSSSWGEGTSDATQGGEGQGAPSTTNDATWIHRFFNTQLWTAQGGDFVAAASATTNVGATGTYSWTSATMLADAQGWFTNPATNFGWMIRGSETVNASAKRFNTRENGTVAQRPVLTVVYTPIPPVTGACCQDGVCTVLSAAACAAAGGTYQGDNALCAPNPCPQPTGACCVAGVCSTQTAADCAAQGGTYQGNNTPCTPNPCNAGTTVTMDASKDNTLYETATGNLSNGAGIGFIVGRAGQANQRRRGVIAFDVSGIPSNAIITNVRLRLFMGFTADGAPRAINVHRALADWGEGTSNAPNNETGGANSTPNDATWIHRFFNTVLWTTPGGEFTAAASATTTVGTANGFFEWTSAALAADVQAWLGNPATNFGWEMIGGENNNNSQRRFESRTNGTATNRPSLIVTYTVPPPTGACCMGAGSCTALTQANCTAQGGTYQGDNITCTVNPCPQPMGACCLSSGLCTTVTAAQCTAQGGTYDGDNSACDAARCPIILTPFVDALPIMPVAQPVSGQAGGAGDYVIGMTEFTQRLHRDLPPTRLWGYDGTFPGPTIEARRDQPVTVTWVNNLRDTSGALRTMHYFPVDTCLHGPSSTGGAPVTVVHFHGGHVAPASDGDPDAAFPPGQASPVYHYPNDQRATTLWYHDHGLGLTRLNVYMGLAGAYVLRDAQEEALELPRGRYEIPLLIQDRSFNPDGSLLYDTEWHDHFFGKFVLVNGKVWPFLNVNRGKYRFRVVNGSNTRVYTLSLSNGAAFHIIGSDQGLLPAPAPLTSITVSPGERADIVVDFAAYAPGTEIILTNSAPAPFPLGEPENDIANVMKFVVQDQSGGNDPLPASLVPVPQIPESESVVSRQFLLRTLLDPDCGHETWFINDLRWDDITDFPRVGTTETWSFINSSNFTHPMHIHLVSFQILDRQNITFVNDEPVPVGPRVPPAPDEAGWKDVVRAHPFQITRVIMRFEGFSGRYPFHCHILEHEDNEMMRQFNVLCDAPVVVTEPAAASAAIGASAMFGVQAAGDVLAYEWRRDGGLIVDGITAQGSVISGSLTAVLTLSNVRSADAGDYSCTITNPCGIATTQAVRLSVTCRGDFNGDGGLSSQDLFDFIAAYFNLAPNADFDHSGTINSQDFFDFLAAFFAGC